MSTAKLISVEKIEKVIYLIRGEKVILDRDLADLYGSVTRRWRLFEIARRLAFARVREEVSQSLRF